MIELNYNEAKMSTTSRGNTKWLTQNLRIELSNCLGGL